MPDQPQKSKQYFSNTFAGTSNNFIITGKVAEPKTSRIFYRVCESGTFNYVFGFSNTVDSTYGDGTACCAGTAGGEWMILSAAAGDGGISHDSDSVRLTNLTFDGESVRVVRPGETFRTDPAELNIPEGHYLCFEITFTSRTKIQAIAHCLTKINQEYRRLPTFHPPYSPQEC